MIGFQPAATTANRVIRVSGITVGKRAYFLTAVTQGDSVYVYRRL